MMANHRLVKDDAVSLTTDSSDGKTTGPS